MRSRFSPGGPPPAWASSAFRCWCPPSGPGGGGHLPCPWSPLIDDGSSPSPAPGCSPLSPNSSPCSSSSGSRVMLRIPVCSRCSNTSKPSTCSRMPSWPSRSPRACSRPWPTVRDTGVTRANSGPSPTRHHRPHRTCGRCPHGLGPRSRCLLHRSRRPPWRDWCEPDCAPEPVRRTPHRSPGTHRFRGRGVAHPRALCARSSPGRWRVRGCRMDRVGTSPAPHGWHWRQRPRHPAGDRHRVEHRDDLDGRGSRVSRAAPLGCACSRGKWPECCDGHRGARGRRHGGGSGDARSGSFRPRRCPRQWIAGGSAGLGGRVVRRDHRRPPGGARRREEGRQRRGRS